MPSNAIFHDNKNSKPHTRTKNVCIIMYVGTTSLKLFLIVLLPYANLLNVQLQINILNNQHIFIGFKLLNLSLQANTNRKCKMKSIKK